MKRFIDTLRMLGLLSSWVPVVTSRRTGMRLLSTLALLGILSLSFVATAAAYPDRPIRIIVPYAAGGTADTIARKIGQYLSKYLGQPIIVDNRPGAGGIIGASTLAQSSSDGYVLGMLGTPHVATPADSTSGFDVSQVKPVSLVAIVPSLLCVNPSVPANSLKDIIVLARAKPGELTYGNPGTFSAAQLAMELFKQQANVDIRAIPYRGGAPAFQDLLGGQIHMAVSGPSNCLPFIQTGQLRPIGMTGANRSAAAPNVPTFAESGLVGFELNEWWGIFGPNNVPPDILVRLNTEINRAVQEPEVREFFARMGAEPQGRSLDEFAAFFTKETKKLKELVGSLGLK
jgi:tripartite-type tricarboxylate transporter receptor subunit TctC